MVRDGRSDEPDIDAVLDALEDPDCRSIITILSEPMTAEEISDAADIPRSTAYRKLETLTDASLLKEGVELRSGGQHASLYALAFEEVTITLTEDRQLDVEISGRPSRADERLANLWSEVRKET